MHSVIFRKNLRQSFMQSASSSHKIRTNSTQSAPTLPRLPVPKLHLTLQKYLKSIQPFLLEDEARGGLPFESSYNIRVKWAEDFEHGLGQICQERLLALDKASPNNWLDDNFWLKKAYHEWRAPLLINSNWWLALNHDPIIPEDVIYGRAPSRKSGFTEWQVRRASWLVYRLLDFKARLERQELHPDTTRSGLWFRRTALLNFNISRIPRMKCDTLSSVPPRTDPGVRKVLVLVHDWLYTVEVLAEDMQPLSPSVIERRLRSIVLDVERRLEKGEMAVPIGVLTTDERDRWAENLQYLLSLSPTNHQSFNAINSSVFAVSLDHYTYTLSDSSSDSPLPLPPPDSPLELTAHLHNVRSGRGDRPVHNRWYDKPIDLVVECNTRAGVLGEHSPCDALVPSIIAEYAVVQSLDEGAYGRLGEEADAEVAGWDRLEWVVDERIKRECADAEGRAKLIVDDSDDDLLWYRTYGVEWIKNSARLSPDAYIQMALQLAWYRMRGCFTATYETALTRLFHHGRTETIRTFTTDSRAFVLAMVEGKTSTSTLHALLRRAIQTHSNLTRDAATGRGIDRHLLGLQEMFLSDAGERHALFEDELFARSQIWKLSTSGLSAGHQFRGTGFGAQYNDGYGINYTAGPDNIKFGIESKHSSSLTSTREFKSAVVRALDDMRSVCLENVGVRL